ncbi:hypothetical protein D3C84_472660 [compost metagenome]
MIVGPIKRGEEHLELQRLLRVLRQRPGRQQRLKTPRNVVVGQQEFGYDIEELLLAMGRKGPITGKVKDRLAVPGPARIDEVLANLLYAENVPVEQVRKRNQGREGARQQRRPILGDVEEHADERRGVSLPEYPLDISGDVLTRVEPHRKPALQRIESAEQVSVAHRFIGLRPTEYLPPAREGLLRPVRKLQCYPESLAGPPLHDLGDPALRAEVHQRDERGERRFRSQLEEGEERAFPEGRRVRVLRVFESELHFEPLRPVLPFRLVFDDEREQDFGC